MKTITTIGNSFYDQVVSSALADNTRIAYEKGWNCFKNYCTRNAITPLSATPENVADFVIELATQRSPLSGKFLSMGTLSLYRSAVNHKFVSMGLPSPTNNPEVNTIFKGLLRIRGKSCRQVQALREHHIRKMLTYCDQKLIEPATRLISLRDAAIIVIGYAGALRRSEICGLTVDDIGIMDTQHYGQEPQEMFITIRQSKTDQEGKGHKIAIPGGRYLKPIKRLKDWLDASGITQGYIFQTMRRGGSLRGLPMHPTDIPRIVKHYAKLIGLDPREISGHSLRAGFVTSAAANHARLDKIMQITRHSNPTTVMKYMRDADSFTDHAGKKFL